jgi:hypothetical protein
LDLNVERVKLPLIRVDLPCIGSNCGFYSFEQCMAKPGANGGFCRRNAFEDPYCTGHTTYTRYRAAIRVGQVIEAAHQFFLLLITFDCSIAANPNRN